MISSSRLAELQHVPPAWKFCAARSQERFDRENAQRADRRKWKTTARPRKHCPAARIEATKKQAREEDREEVEVLRGSRHGVAGCPAASATPGGCPLAWLRRWGPRPAANTWVFEPASLSLKVTNAPINPNLGSISKTDLETRGKHRELKRKLSERALTQRKARAREEPSPGPPTSETDAGPPGHQPRGGAPARPRLSRGQEGPT